jgi:hypothetical protein
VRWNQGRATIEKLVADGELQLVPPSRERADQLITQARKDLSSAKLLSDSNPKRAYESLYDAARMALTAVLENEGLRPTSRGGHLAPYSAVAAQLDPPMGAGGHCHRRHLRERPRRDVPVLAACCSAWKSRARCVPDRMSHHGDSRSVTDQALG